MNPQKIIFALFLILSSSTYAQEIKPDGRSQLSKEDANNTYHAEEIDRIDLLQALEFAGIEIAKFNIGEFSHKGKIYLVADEYVSGQKVNTDTVFTTSNQYHYYERGSEDPFLDYIDQIKIISKQDEHQMDLRIITYSVLGTKKIKLTRERDDQFFLLRKYQSVEWKEGEKIPLMVFASSWRDEDFGVERFCGVAKLAQDDEPTNELLNSSPHYIVVSYMVK